MTARPGRRRGQGRKKGDRGGRAGRGAARRVTAAARGWGMGPGCWAGQGARWRCGWVVGGFASAGASTGCSAALGLGATSPTLPPPCRTAAVHARVFTPSIHTTMAPGNTQTGRPARRCRARGRGRGRARAPVHVRSAHTRGPDGPRTAAPPPPFRVHVLTVCERIRPSQWCTSVHNRLSIRNALCLWRTACVGGQNLLAHCR